MWNIWSGSYTWPDFPVGSSVTVQLRGTAALGFTGTVTNTAVVTSSVPDPNPDNNSSEDTVTVEPGADLTVSKTAEPDSITAGQRVVYTITAGNLGPGRAENVIIQDAASPYPDGDRVFHRRRKDLASLERFLCRHISGSRGKCGNLPERQDRAVLYGHTSQHSVCQFGYTGPEPGQ